MLHRGVHVPVGIGGELLPLVTEVEEGHHPPCDRVASGLDAGHAQQQEEHVELARSQSLAVDVGGQQRGDDVVGGRAAALRLEFVGVAEQLGRGPEDVSRVLMKSGSARPIRALLQSQTLARPSTGMPITSATA